MFQMINEEKSPDGNKLLGDEGRLIPAGLALMGGAVYFFALVTFQE